ncbi:unnamed protein product [Knipowitschia caucasica]
MGKLLWLVLLVVLVAGVVEGHRHRRRPRSVRPCGPPKEICWTRWFDIDNPSGNGDFEWIRNIKRKHPKEMCRHPVDIQARTLRGLTAKSARNRVYTNTRTGFSCINREQRWGRKCHDYRVRFACYKPYCAQKVCWTRWLNGDRPQRRGDYETLRRLRRRYPGVICRKPLKIQAETVHGRIPAELSGQTFQLFNPTQGLVCRNSRSQRCKDYRVRFGCNCK